MKDYYKILRILPTASQDLIREAYKVLMRELANGRSGLSEEEVKQLTGDVKEAFEILGDSVKRAAYDRRYLESLLFGKGQESPGSSAGPSSSTAEAVAPSPHKVYEELKRETEAKGRTWEDFMKLQSSAAPPRTHLKRGAELANGCSSPMPVYPEETAVRYEFATLEEGLAVAASLSIDGKVGEALQVLQKLEGSFLGDPEYAKVLYRSAELYFKTLGAPEKALEYYRRILSEYPASVEALMAERRVDALERLTPRPPVQLPTGKILQDLGEVWMVECPRCSARVRTPARTGSWFLCPNCGEKFLPEVN